MQLTVNNTLIVSFVTGSTGSCTTVYRSFQVMLRPNVDNSLNAQTGGCEVEMTKLFDGGLVVCLTLLPCVVAQPRKGYVSLRGNTLQSNFPICWFSSLSFSHTFFDRLDGFLAVFFVLFIVAIVPNLLG